MNYKAHYERLIDRSKRRTTRVGYMEKHHIVPKCVGGSDDPANLVWLTAREHYVQHQILTKLYPKEYGITYAAMLMTMHNSQHIGNRSANRLYGWLREKLSEFQKERMLGEGNSQYGTRWVCRVGEVRKIQAGDFQQYIENGWVSGRKCREQSYVLPQELQEIGYKRRLTVSEQTKAERKLKCFRWMKTNPPLSNRIICEMFDLKKRDVTELIRLQEPYGWRVESHKQRFSK